MAKSVAKMKAATKHQKASKHRQSKMWHHMAHRSAASKAHVNGEKQHQRHGGEERK